MWRGRFVLLVGLAGFMVLGCPAASATPMERVEPVSRADHIAAALARDPVYVTDHAPRSLPPDAAARIKASIARLGVPAYVAVTPTVGIGQENPADSLVPLLRDRLRKDGVYLVVDPSGGHGEARQFGGSRRLPVDDAWSAADFELPYDATAPEMIERFVEIALSGHARERRDHPHPEPKSKLREALDADDAADRRAAHIEWGLFGGGAVLSGGTILGLLIWRRVRSPKPRRKPTVKARTKKVQAKRKQRLSKQKGRR
ncbi:hypothetical protein E1293_00825 [Actinomadura darangshiensis]|uniref:TPM domain-containing protein n=1 Tax=Actinomadura darangshiensis TaxID=705336 RepID=A0A4R5C3C6_9ACTN|nr:hypothetical protein [Actinomadura darangshiensis]TDD92553.1 hypothetical protein E1293_00825 [Actinomadura darangshiensis]